MLEVIKIRLATSERPAAKRLVRFLKSLRAIELPAPKAVFLPLFTLHRTAAMLLGASVRVLYWTPLFKSQLASCGRKLFLDGGMPQIMGRLHIEFGDDVRISGATSLAGRTGDHVPQLIVGSNIDIGWQTAISVGTKVVIEDDVRMSGRSTLSGYPGHPLNPADRAKGLPDTSDQIGDIVIERGAWLGVGVVVTSGVRIGQGTVVAAGSVVTHDLPPNVLAAGMPARVVRALPSTDAS